MADVETTHAVYATGEDTTPLIGGRSRLTANGVPILELRDELAEAVSESARALVDPDQQTEWLIGHAVVVDNPQPSDGIADDGFVVFHIGAETLDEAAKTVIGKFEATYGAAAPEWVESTHPVLGAVIADHYGCEDRSARYND